MREAFFDELLRLAEQGKNVALVVGDIGFSVVERFADRFPERFVNAGVAEQNMMGLAAGMASEGVHVFVYSIANFPTFRCAEQIRNDVDYHRLPVTVVAVGGGLAYGNLGYSHHAVQDYGLLRAMPNMLIAAPGDPMEVRACMSYLGSNPGPSYLRLGKAGELCLHEKLPVLAPGQWLRVSGERDADRTILTTGAALSVAMKLRSSQRYSDYAVHSLPLWGMGHKHAQIAQVERWAKVHTFEDHLADCGFGSWLREAVSVDRSEFNLRIETSSLDPKVCGMVGNRETLERLGGLQ